MGGWIFLGGGGAHIEWINSAPPRPLFLHPCFVCIYRLPYNNFLGGVIAATPTMYQLVNGYSNAYFGWGAEDDDFQNRSKS